MSDDERKQSEAVLILGMILALWLSHYVVVGWPEAAGNYDLQRILRFWNKPIWINWIAALGFFFSGGFLGRKLWRQMSAQELRSKQRDARWLASKTDGRKKNTVEYRRIL